ncbi:MAG TPA: hypothetical protein VN622_01495 [Clostridia bacterium]|nr:hypothetical protein [Clostridia bacterium]
MPLARIRTDDPQAVSQLVAELCAAGFELEYVHPLQKCATEADLEVRVERLATDDAMTRASELNMAGLPIYVAPGVLGRNTAFATQPDSQPLRRDDLSLYSPYAESLRLRRDAERGVPGFISKFGGLLSVVRAKAAECLQQGSERLRAALVAHSHRQAERRALRDAEIEAQEQERARVAAQLRTAQLERERSDRELRERLQRERIASQSIKEPPPVRAEVVGQERRESEMARDKVLAREEAARRAHAETARSAPEQASHVQPQREEQRQRESYVEPPVEPTATNDRNREEQQSQKKDSQQEASQSTPTHSPVPPAVSRASEVAGLNPPRFTPGIRPPHIPATGAVTHSVSRQGLRQRAYKQAAVAAAVITIALILLLAALANRRPANPLDVKKLRATSSMQQDKPFGPVKIPAPNLTSSPSGTAQANSTRSTIRKPATRKSAKRKASGQVRTRQLRRSQSTRKPQTRDGVRIASDLD